MSPSALPQLTPFPTSWHLSYWQLWRSLSLMYRTQPASEAPGCSARSSTHPPSWSQTGVRRLEAGLSRWLRQERPDSWRLFSQLGEPAQGAQARKEAIFATASDNEARQVLQAAPDGLLRDGDAARSVVMPGHRVFFAGEPDEIAVVDPLGLDELELPVQVGADEDPDQAPVGTIVFEHALRQRRAVAGAAADDAVHPCHPDDGGIARVDASDMRTGGTLEAAIVVFPVEEVIVE